MTCKGVLFDQHRITSFAVSIEITDVLVRNYVNLTNTHLLFRFALYDSFLESISFLQLDRMGNLSVLILCNVSLHTINNNSFNLPHLNILTISHNPLTVLSDAFFKLKHLSFFDISHTNVQMLSANLIFKDLHSLYLQHTYISQLAERMLASLKSVQIISLSHTHTTLDSYTGVQVLVTKESLESIYLVHHEACCLFSLVCTSDNAVHDIFFSCGNIIVNIFQHVVLYAYIITILLTNILAIHWYFVSAHNVQKSLIACLCGADLVMVVYLFLIMAANYHWADDIFYVSIMWKRSALCKVAGTFLMVSILTSNMYTAMITIDRYWFLVINPFRKYGFTAKHAVFFSVVLIIISILISSLSSIFSIQIKNTMCVLIGNSITLPFTIIYTVFYFVILPLVLSMCITIIKVITKSSAIQASSQKRNKSTVVRLALVAITNMVPCTIISLLSLASLSPNTIPATLEATLTFLLIPINSFLNPVINVLSAKDYIEHVKQHSVIIQMKHLGRRRKSALKYKSNLYLLSYGGILQRQLKKVQLNVNKMRQYVDIF